MKKYAILICLTFSVIFFSCAKKDKDKEAGIFANAVEKVNVNKNMQWVVVLPGLGCKGCIQEGEAFMQKYINNPDILFVLTNIESLKILQQKIHVNIKEHSNIYIDKDRLFDLPTNNSIYPCIIKLENGRLATYQFQSPNNGQAFEKLKTEING